MPVIMRTSYTGSGDTFRFFEDGRPLSGAENYDYVDERDLTPEQVRALEELNNSVKQAAPKDVWSGELGNSAGAPAPPADPALATRPQRVPPEGDAPPPAPPVPPMGAGPGMSPISGPMPTGAPAAPPPDNPAQQWNPSYAPPDTQGPQAMRRAGTPWGEMRYHAPPHSEGGAQAIIDTVPSSPVQITSDFITDQVMRGLEQGGQGSMPPVSHSAFGWGQGLGEWARQHVPEPVLSAMGLPPTSAAPMTPDPLPMQRAGQPWGEMQYFRQPPLESFSPSSFGNPSGQMGPDIINVNIPPGTGGRPGQAAQQPLVDPAVMGTLTDQVNALRGQGTGSGNVEVAGVQYRYNPVLGIFEVVR